MVVVPQMIDAWNERRFVPNRRRREVERGLLKLVDPARVRIDAGHRPVLFDADQYGSTVHVRKSDEDVRQRGRVNLDALAIEPVVLSLGRDQGVVGFVAVELAESRLILLEHAWVSWCYAQVIGPHPRTDGPLQEEELHGSAPDAPVRARSGGAAPCGPSTARRGDRSSAAA